MAITLMIPSKVSSHVRFLLMEFNDSDYHSLAQEICEVLSLSFRSMDLNSLDAILTETDKETSVGDFIEELGYGFTSDASLCKEILSLFMPLTEAAISRILVVVRTYAGLKDNYDTFTTFSLSVGCCI